MTSKTISAVPDAIDVVSNYIKTGSVGVGSANAVQGVANDKPIDAAIAGASALHSATSLIKSLPGIGGGIALADLVNAFTDPEKNTLQKITSVTGALAVAGALGAGDIIEDDVQTSLAA